MDLISFIIILLILYLLYKILHCGKKNNIEGFIDDIELEGGEDEMIEQIYINIIQRMKNINIGLTNVSIPINFDSDSLEGDYLNENDPENTKCKDIYKERLIDIITDKLDNDDFIDVMKDENSKITAQSIEKGVEEYLSNDENYNEFFEETTNLLGYFNCMQQDTPNTVNLTRDGRIEDEDLKRSIDIKVEKLNIPVTNVDNEVKLLQENFTPKIEEFCKRYKEDSNVSLNLLDFKPIPLEADTLQKQNIFLEEELVRHTQLDKGAKAKLYNNCKNIVGNHVNNIIALKKSCHKNGERCFDTIKDQKIKQSTNVNLTDNKNFSEYLNNCNKDFNRCGYLDDDQPPLNYLESKNEYINTLNNYNNALLNFKSIQDNEKLRLELYKKTYGLNQWNEGYNSPPPPPPEKKVNEYQKDTPKWIINDISDIEEKKIVNTKLLDSEKINVDQTKESIKNLTRQNFILDEKILKYDKLIRDHKSEKVSLNKLPLRCEECVPCRTCNKCITLSKYEDLNKCPKCPGCNQEVNISIDTQKTICDTRILQLQNELDGVVTKKQNDLKNDERWPELNSKLTELSRKKALQSSSMRSCENEKLIKDTGIQESIRNIKRMKLKNEELQDRIDHERDVVSWLDRLKGVSKPFKPKKNYSIGIEEPKDESSE